jgi:hypothetical protein
MHRTHLFTGIAALALTGGLLSGQPAAPTTQPSPATAPSVPTPPVVSPPPAAATAPETLPDGHVRRLVPGTRISLAVPEDWKRLRLSAGAGTPDGSVEVAVVEVPQPYMAVARLLGPDGVFVQGFTVDVREEARIQGRDAMIAHGVMKTKAGPLEGRWWLVFGTARQAVVISGTYAPEKHPEHKELVKSVIMTTNWDALANPNALARLPFRFTPPPMLKLGGSIGERIMFTEDGGLVPNRPGAPTMMLYLQRAGEDALDEAAQRKRAETLGGTGRPTKLVEFAAVTIGGLKGFEAIVELEDKGTKVQLYTLQLVDGKGVYNLIGQADPGNPASGLLNAYKESARSIRPLTDAEHKW